MVLHIAPDDGDGPNVAGSNNDMQKSGYLFATIFLKIPRYNAFFTTLLEDPNVF
jgi:hypothetical protein